jgi:gluconokinase
VAWTHIIANALNRPLHVLAEDEVTARGAAILALRAIGLASLADFPPTIAYSIEPIPALVEILRAARERQLELYARTVVG